GAVESNARAHLNEGTALRQLCGLFILHPHQGRALIVLQDSDGADRDFVSGFRLSDGLPLSGGADQGDDEYGCDDDRDYEEGLFQCKFPEHQICSITLKQMGISVNRVCVPPDTVSSMISCIRSRRWARADEASWDGSYSLHGICIAGGAAFSGGLGERSGGARI